MLLYVFSLLTILTSYYEIEEQAKNENWQKKKKKKHCKKWWLIKKNQQKSLAGKKKIGKNCWSAKNNSHLAKI